MVAISIPVSEIQRARVLYRFTTYDERGEFGMLRLRSDGVRRIWVGSDNREGMVLLGGSDTGVYDISLSWATISAAEAAVDGDESADVTIEAVTSDDVPLIHVTGPHGRSTYWDRQLGYPVIQLPLFPEDRIAGQATIAVDRLRAALTSVSVRRIGGDEEKSNDSIRMTFHNGEIVLQKREAEVGRLDVSAAAPGAWSNVSVDVSSSAMSRVLDAVRPSDDVTITLSISNGDPLAFESADWFAYVMPFRTENALASDRVEELLREMFGPVALHIDDDGDYPLKLHGNQIYGRFNTDDDGALWFQVFAIVIRDISPSPEVFAELNDLNANTRYVRLFLVDGQVLAEVDLLAATLDKEELSAAIDRITQITDEVMPTLSAVLGGTVPGDASERRWAAYRPTILEAEVRPGYLYQLNGPDAVDEFPFPDRCFAITAWNPMGTMRPPQKNRELNQAVATDVINQNGMFVRGFGSSPDGEYSEETLFVWGLDLESVREMGRRAQQDAIFEVTDEVIRLVSCFDDRVEEWPRRPSQMPLPLD